MNKFVEKLNKIAKNKKFRIGFYEIEDKRILTAATIIYKRGIASPILIGNTKVLHRNAKKWTLDIQGIQTIDPTTFEKRKTFEKKLYLLRKHKGITPEDAIKYLNQITYFSTMLLKENYVDALIAGARHSTAEVFRPAFQIIKTKKKGHLASSYFILHNDEEILLFADSSINVDPTSEEMAEIAISTNDTAKQIGLTPKTALLSFSTHHSSEHPILKKVRDALKIIKRKRKDMIVDGEIQFDAAYDKAAAKIKAKDSPIGGKANIFIFPELNSSNISYKIAKLLGHYRAIGPIVQGLNKHVNDLSRGCNIEEIVELGQITVYLDKKEKLQKLKDKKKKLQNKSKGK